jgi:RNA polymerase-interacting CarD/CdnL/TRCF family regulator
VRLDVGDVVVYASHGIGRVAGRDERTVLGAQADVVVLEFADGLTVTLPLTRARELLRPLAGEAEVLRVRETLREDSALVQGESWLKRHKDAKAKLAAGGPIDLAEIVRDWSAVKRPGMTNSDGGRKILVRARALLVGELSAALGLESSQAADWVDEQLAHTAT